MKALLQKLKLTNTFTGIPIVLVSNADYGDAGDLQIVRASTINATNFLIKAFAVDGTGGGSLNITWLAIGPA